MGGIDNNNNDKPNRYYGWKERRRKKSLVMSSLHYLERVPTDEDDDEYIYAEEQEPTTRTTTITPIKTLYQEMEQSSSTTPSTIWSTPDSVCNIRSISPNIYSSGSTVESFSSRSSMNPMSNEDEDSTRNNRPDEDYRGLQLHTEYSKYFLMLRAGVPKQWVVKVCEVDGRDPTLLDQPQDVLLRSPQHDETYYYDSCEHLPSFEDNKSNNDLLSSREETRNSSPILRSSPTINEDEDEGDDNSNTTIELLESYKKNHCYKSSETFREYCTRIRNSKNTESSQPIQYNSIEKDDKKLIESQGLKSEENEGLSSTKTSCDDRTKNSNGGGFLGFLFGRNNNDDNDDEVEANDVAPMACTSRTILAGSFDEQDDKSVPQIDSNFTTGSNKSSSLVEETTETETNMPSYAVEDDDDDNNLPLTKDPQFSRYFLMVKARVPLDRVRQVVQMDGKNPAILDLDPQRSFASQAHLLIDNDDDDDDDNQAQDEVYDRRSSNSRTFSFKMSNPHALRSPESKPRKALTNYMGDEHHMEEDHEDDDLCLADSFEKTMLDESMSLETKRANIAALLASRNISTTVTDQPEEDNDDDGIMFADSFEQTMYDEKMPLEKKKAKVAALFASRTVAAGNTNTSFHQPEGYIRNGARARTTSPVTTDNRENAETAPSHNLPSEDENAKVSESAIRSNRSARPTSATRDREYNASAAELLSKKTNKFDKVSALFARRRVPTATATTDSTNDHNEHTKSAATIATYNKAAIVDSGASLEDKKANITALLASRNQTTESITSAVTATDENDSYDATQRGDISESAPRHDSSDASLAHDDKKVSIGALLASRNTIACTREPKTENNLDTKASAKHSEEAGEAITIIMDRSELDRYSKWKAKDPADEKEDIPLQENPEYKKYFKMLQVGLPLGAVKQAMIKDGKDPSILDKIDASKAAGNKNDPDTTSKPKAKSTKDGDEPDLKNDPAYQKYFKMLKLGLPIGAVKQAMLKDGKDPSILDLNPNEPLSSQRSTTEKKGNSNEPLLKDHPDYEKYFKMLKLGLPLGAAKQAMMKDGKDPNILDLDPAKTLSSQGNSNEETACTNEPLLKDQPEYEKYFKMLKLGLPIGAAKQAMMKDGKDPTILDLDPEKPLGSQRKDGSKQNGAPTKAKQNKIVHKRLFWNSIDKSSLRRGSLWSKFQSDSSLNLNDLDYDEEEFANLFTMDKDKEKKAKHKKAAETTQKPKQKETIQLIDSRRQMNGSILLTKYKHDHRELAHSVNTMNSGDMCETELRALIQLLPSKDEALAIRSYLPANESDKEDAISKLGLCEKYMASMLEVDNASGKLKSMIYRVQFDSLVSSLEEDLESLREALDCVRNSDRLTRLMLFALKLGNTLNANGGRENDVVAITLDSLLKLQEAKAFDKKTSVLQYLVTIIDKNDKDVLNVSTDLLPALKAERIVLELLTKSLTELREGLESTKKTTEGCSTKETPMKSFLLDADTRLRALSYDIQKCKKAYADVLTYFGENPNLPLNDFFRTLSTFIAMFESARAELRRLQEAKERKERRKATSKTGIIKDAVDHNDASHMASGRSAVLHEIVQRQGSTATCS